jgi:hypothetical protein
VRFHFKIKHNNPGNIFLRRYIIWRLSLLILFFSLPLSKQAQAQCKLDRSNYRIVFQDEFNYKNIEELRASGRWDTDGFDGPGTEFYTASQIEFPGNGILRLKASLLPTGSQRKKLDNEAARSGIKRRLNIAYASARLKSKFAYDSTHGPKTWRKADWTKGFAYGMFEIRCKLPSTGKGVWPAFWLLSPGSEIDVIDNNSDQPERYLSSGVLDWDKRNLYCATNGNAACDSLPLGAWTCGGRGLKEGRDLSQDFNTYTVVWTPKQVSFFLNDREQYTVTSAQVGIHDYTASIITSLQLREDAEKLGIKSAEMEIDYINVYKPTDKNYTVSYDKSDQEYKNITVQSKSKTWPEYISSSHKSIATNPNNKNEVFFRGTNNLLYWGRQGENNTWETIEVDPQQAQHPDWLIGGDVVFNAKYGLIIYQGQDGRLQAYSYYNTWHHKYLDSNGSANWRPSLIPGNIASAATTGDIYYIGSDKNIHLLHLSDSTWTHSYISYTNTNDSTYKGASKLALGDIVLEESSKKIKVYYKGTDYRIQTLYPSNNTYAHTYLELGEQSSSAIVDDIPGSIAQIEKGNVFFIGKDKLIHRYNRLDKANEWQHELLTDAQNTSYLPYKGNITWDKAKEQLIYFGTDGRLQCYFLNSAKEWTHRWVDNYYNTPLFKGIDPQVVDTQYTSLTVGPTGDIFYRGRSNEFHYFTYTGCRYINPNCENWNMSLSFNFDKQP